MSKALNNPKQYQNAIVIDAGCDDVITAYNWLKSASRNSAMGVASATNRRCLILSPGTYKIASKLLIDTNFIDICALTSLSTENTIIKAPGTLANYYQKTAADAELIGFTIIATGNTKLSFCNNAQNFGSSSSGINIAASNSSAKDKRNADYICDGIDDNIQLQANIDDLATLGGNIHLAAGTYVISAPVVLKSGVSIYGVMPLTTSPEVFANDNAPADNFIISGGTILTGKIGTETIFTANTSARPATDYGIMSCDIVGIGFKNVGKAIDVGGQDHSGFYFSNLRNIIVENSAYAAISIGNFQHSRFENIYMINVNGGLYLYNQHRMYEGGCSEMDNIFVKVKADAAYGIKLEAIPSGYAPSTLDFIQGSRLQVNVYSGTSPAGIVLKGNSSLYTIASKTDATHLVITGTANASWLFAGAITDSRARIRITKADGTEIATYHVKSVTVGANITIETWEAVSADVIATGKIYLTSATASYVQLLDFQTISVDGQSVTNRITGDYVQKSRFGFFAASADVAGAPKVVFTNSRYLTLDSVDEGMQISMDSTTNYSNELRGVLKKPTGTYVPLGLYRYQDSSVRGINLAMSETLEKVIQLDTAHTTYVQQSGKMQIVNKSTYNWATKSDDLTLDAGRTKYHTIENTANINVLIENYNIAGGTDIDSEWVITKTSNNANTITIICRTGNRINGVDAGTGVLVLDAQYESACIKRIGDNDLVVMWKNF